MKKVSKKLAALLAGCLMLTGCSAGTQIDDYATNLTTNSSGQNTQGQQVQSETHTRMTLVFREYSRTLVCPMNR